MVKLISMLKIPLPLVTCLSVKVLCCIVKHLFFFFSQSELHYIYTQQLEKHFIIHANQSQHSTSDTSSQEATVEGHSHHHGSGDQDRVMRDLLSGITHVTVELQDHLRSMFLPTSQRCHYIFTMTDLTMVFRYDFLAGVG